MHQVILPKLTSYHFLILPQGKQVSLVKCPFKFENMWLEVDGFIELVNHFGVSSKFLVLQVLSWQRSLIFLSLDSKSGIRKSLLTGTLRWPIWWTRLSLLIRKNDSYPFL